MYCMNLLILELDTNDVEVLMIMKFSLLFVIHVQCSCHYYFILNWTMLMLIMKFLKVLCTS